MDDNDFNPSQTAAEMQLRTRRAKKFDEVEANLPDPKASSPPAASTLVASSYLSFGGIIDRITSLNPFGKAVGKGDVVWLLDNTAFRTSRHGPWQAEFVTAVFEQEAKCKVVDIVSGVAHAMGLADDAEERETIEQRLMPFMWDVRRVRTLTADHNGKMLKLGPTGFNGISTNVLRVQSRHRSGTTVKTTAEVPSGVHGILSMNTYYAGPEGWAIISDIDDTIKITSTSDPSGILAETFANEPSPVPAMPELYADIKAMLPRDTPWFYLSASPYNLYPFLRDFRDRYYPPGTLILRDMSWKTVAGLLSALTMGTEEYKVDRIKKVNSWIPNRKMILIGDSTQSDPEAYGEMYRAVPGWIKLILIRKATEIGAVGIDEKNDPKRFERAFKGVPRHAWQVFEDPDECVGIIEDLVRRY